MKSFIYLFLFLGYTNIAYGQLAIIKDVDGYTNVRELPNIDSKIIYKLTESEVFIFELPEENKDSNWIPVFISKNKYSLGNSKNLNSLEGFIHKSRLQPIEELPDYNGNNFFFKYKLESFNDKNKICDYKDNFLMQINGRNIYGTDGNIPKIEVKGIDIKYKSVLVEVPKVFYEDIFECSNNFKVIKNKEDFILYQWNSDGAGGYLIAWVIGDNSIKQRLVFIP
ncbi:conserved hypothetical protein [Tenacibaculum sp. 190524A05c]|uniref:hypothetical protein n=1 Tax=Tenacibaculum platacis TaxID=3137852 RepID=UPI0031FBA223